MQRGNALACFVIVSTNLDRQNPLACCGKEVVRLKRMDGDIEPQSLNPGGGQDHGVAVSGFEQAQARTHIASDRNNFQIRS